MAPLQLFTPQIHLSNIVTILLISILQLQCFHPQSVHQYPSLLFMQKYTLMTGCDEMQTNLLEITKSLVKYIYNYFTAVVLTCPYRHHSLNTLYMNGNISLFINDKCLRCYAGFSYSVEGSTVVTQVILLSPKGSIVFIISP